MTSVRRLTYLLTFVILISYQGSWNYFTSNILNKITYILCVVNKSTLKKYFSHDILNAVSEVTGRLPADIVSYFLFCSLQLPDGVEQNKLLCRVAAFFPGKCAITHSLFIYIDALGE